MEEEAKKEYFRRGRVFSGSRDWMIFLIKAETVFSYLAEAGGKRKEITFHRNRRVENSQKKIRRVHINFSLSGNEHRMPISLLTKKKKKKILYERKKISFQ